MIATYLPSDRAVLFGVVTVAALLFLPSVSQASTPGPPPDSCVAPISPCYITLSISSGSHGNREVVTGTQFWPGEPFTVYLWNGSSTGGARVVASGSTGTGGFTAAFHVPDVAVGNYTVFVTDLAGDNQSAPFHVDQLIAAPTSGAPANTTVLSGHGFLPDHLVKFFLHGVRAPTVAACRTNRTGSFSGCVATIPAVRVGSALLIATDGTYKARLEFVVS